MLSKYGRRFVAEPLAKLVMVLHRAGVTPNMLTYIGFAITAVSAFYLARGSFVWGGAILLLAAFFDMLDGSLARATNQSSVFGAFIDSTLDRYAESITFLALAYYYIITPGGDTQLILIFLIIVGSLMVSYTRARRGPPHRVQRRLLAATGAHHSLGDRANRGRAAAHPVDSGDLHQLHGPAAHLRRLCGHEPPDARPAAAGHTGQGARPR